MKIRVTVEEITQDGVKRRREEYNGRHAETARQQLDNMFKLLEGAERKRRAQRDTRSEILDALSSLGIELERDAPQLEIVPCGANKAIYIDEQYFGIWDERKRTFVD